MVFWCGINGSENGIWDEVNVKIGLLRDSFFDN